MKKILGLPISFMILGLFLISAGTVEAAPYPFSDDFEGGLGNWVAGGQWGLTESNCLDGNFAVTDSPGGNYPDNYDGSLTLATDIDLSAASSPVLIFWHKLWLAAYDYAYVQISTDGGFTWSTLTNWYSDDYLGTWTLSRFDLSAYVGLQVKIRFRLRETNVNVSDGWFIDKVEVREASDEPTIPYPLSDDFEGTLDNWLVSDCEWSIVSSDCLNGNFAVTDSPAGNYPDNANSMITLAGNIDLSTATSPVMIFWHKLWLAAYDYAYVEISTDGGVTWSVLTNWYSDDYLGTWTLSRLDLSAYVGSQVKVRFRLRETNVNESDGWFIDKVEVREANDEPTIPYPLFDDFEGTLDNWLVSGCEWGLEPSDCLSGDFAVTDSPAGNYPDNANSMITLAGNIDLSSATSPVLIFWHKLWLAAYDYAYVEISMDGGVTWSVLTNWYSDDYLGTWTLSRLDLSAYEGMQVKIRFRLRETNVNESDGWYIDKVEVRDANDEPAIPYPFSDNFEGTLDNWLVSDCEWGVVASDGCASGFAITDSPLGNYPNYANSMITLAGDIDLTTATFPVLSFWHKYSIAAYDYAFVEISTDGGVTWSEIINWYSNVYISSWRMEQFDLRPYVGMQVKIRFRLRETNVNEGDGWYLDTISIGEFDTTDGDGVPDELDNCTVIPNWCQRDTDSDNFGNYCDPDFTNDLIVNASDLAYLKEVFFTDDPDGDLNGDVIVNVEDLVILKSMFFKPPGPSGLAP